MSLRMIRISLWVSAAVLVACTIQGCVRRENTVAKPIKGAAVTVAVIPNIDEKNYPKVDGSTSTSPLGQLLLSRALGIEGDLRRTARYGGEGGVVVTVPVKSEVGKLREFRRLSDLTYHTGTHTAYGHLLGVEMDQWRTVRAATRPGPYSDRQRVAELILVAREPSADELALAKKNKIELDVRPVALDAFVFLVNSENKVTSLNLDQIRGVYTGKIKNWKEVGGADKPIQPFGRERNSGSQELMDKLVLKGQKMILVPDRIIYGMSGVIERVSRTPDALSYSVFYYEEVMMPNVKNRLLAIDGILPTEKTIADRNYPLTTEVYVVTRKGIPSDSPAAKLRDWLLSDDGQQLVAESGYVPIRNVGE